MPNKKAQTKPIVQQSVQPQPKKKSKAWLWIILAIILLIAVGIGIYFLVFSGSDGGILGGSSIPQPPALPSG